jgi:hypothetical protein
VFGRSATKKLQNGNKNICNDLYLKSQECLEITEGTVTCIFYPDWQLCAGFKSLSSMYFIRKNVCLYVHVTE